LASTAHTCSAEAGQRHDAVAKLEAFDVGADRLDLTGDLEAGYVRGFRRAAV